MANKILALENAYAIIVDARVKSFGAIEEKLGRIRNYIKDQLEEAVKELGAE